MPKRVIAIVAKRSSDAVRAEQSYVARPSEYAGRSSGGTRAGRKVGQRAGRKVTPRSLCQAVLAIQWLWSLSRLCVAVTNRHSDCAAALPLRMNRSMRRLYLICPNTGSIVIFRCA
jgi:hypothetical protein